MSFSRRGLLAGAAASAAFATLAEGQAVTGTLMGGGSSGPGGTFPGNMPGLGGWWSPLNASTTGGNVDAVTSYGSGPTLTQTGSARPTLVAKRFTFNAASSQYLASPALNAQLSATTLPDGASGSQAGKGFTCTGLARVPGDGTWWVGNYGKPVGATAGSATFAASLVHLSADFSTILKEITLATLGITQSTTQTGPQGVCYDVANGTVWMACPEIGNVYQVNVSSTGSIVSQFAYANANGLAYDPSAASGAGQLVVSTNLLPIQWVDRTGSVQRSLSPALPYFREPPQQSSDNGPIDHLFIDALGFLWVSGGQDGTACSITKVNATTGAILQINNPPLNNATEGIYVDTNTNIATVCNDQFFHPVSGFNQILTFSTNVGGTVWPLWLGDSKMVMAGICKVASTPGSATGLASLGEPLTTGYAAGGAGHYFGSAGDFRAIATNNVDSMANTNTTEFDFFTIFDFGGQLISTWINNVAQTPFAMTVAGTTVAMLNFPNNQAIMGAAFQAGSIARFMTGTCGGLMVGTSACIPYQAQIRTRLLADAA